MTQAMALSYTSAASGSSGSTASLTGPIGEVKLWSNKKEQAMYESYAGERSKSCLAQVLGFSGVLGAYQDPIGQMTQGLKQNRSCKTWYEE